MATSPHGSKLIMTLHESSRSLLETSNMNLATASRTTNCQSPTSGWSCEPGTTCRRCTPTTFSCNSTSTCPSCTLTSHPWSKKARTKASSAKSGETPSRRCSTSQWTWHFRYRKRDRMMSHSELLRTCLWSRRNILIPSRRRNAIGTIMESFIPRHRFASSTCRQGRFVLLLTKIR